MRDATVQPREYREILAEKLFIKLADVDSGVARMRLCFDLADGFISLMIEEREKATESDTSEP